MRTRIILFLIFISVGDSFCQNRNSVWCFGDSAGVDFSSGIATPFSTGVNSRGSAASVSDTTGKLLFYVGDSPDPVVGGSQRSAKVRDTLHQIIPNGDSLVGFEWYLELTINDKPASNNEYYIFSIGVTNNDGFYYSIVDMNQNGGLGAVTQKNVQLQSFQCADGLTTIKHGNGRDWWVFFRRWDTVNDEFYKYLISPSGVSNVQIQHVGSSTNNGFTKLRFNNAGNKMVMINYFGLLELYDFDRCTGILSNPVTIHPEPTNTYYHFWSAEFSQNSRFLYVTAYDDTCYLYQYDLLSPTPANTRITLDTIINDLIGIGNLRLAPDGKIYLSHAWECTAFPFCYPYPDSVYNYVNMNLSVINYPDSLGTACGYAPFSFYLGGKRAYYGLPNNPDYELGAVTGSICDSLTGITNNEQEIKNELFVYYNSSWQKAFINAKGLKGRNSKMSVYDLLGNIIYSEEEKLSSQYYTRDLNLAAFAKGMYVVNLTTEKERMVKKFIKD